MKPQKPTPTCYEPFTRPQSVAALREELRAGMPEVDAMESFSSVPGEQPARRVDRVIITAEDGTRKVICNGETYDYLEDDDDDDTCNLPDDDEPTSYEYDTDGAFIIRAGDEWHARNDDDIPADAMLFGPLWMQNELCIMFADTNVGKSILAVQIADSLSRGLPIPGFALTAPAAPVLYFDFELGEQQFRSRYSSAAQGKYPFTANFKRATLNPFTTKQKRFASYEEFINNEIENALLATKAKALIIDNITCLRYGTQSAAGALNLMEYLQHIKRTYQISILVLAHPPKRNTTRPLSRNDLQGSKMLINLADSAFTIGESQLKPGLRYLKQIKQRSISEIYGAENVCLGRIVRTHSMLHFTFAGCAHENDHLTPQNEQYRRSTEHRIAELTKHGNSIRQVAAKLGLASTTVFRALKRLERCDDTETPPMTNNAAPDDQKYFADKENADIPANTLMTNDKPTNDQPEGFTETEALYETLIYANQKAADIPANPPMTNDKATSDQKAPCDSLPGEGREGFTETEALYETLINANPKAADIPANPQMTNDKATNDQKAAQVIPAPQMTNDKATNDQHTGQIIEITLCHEAKKSRRSKKTNVQPAAYSRTAHPHAPAHHTLSISDEIEGLTYLAKYEPFFY